ncbi:hypothetical protein LL033_25295 (plasmid) [Clostridium estertheticum]|uniref:alpha/beta hydrolase family protein n=1 Tax=Clostridium estertheticum TaxID=238834 RepID=UPI001C0DDB4A|nr:hypothetical protein [Clostridium estertheticum]MBU3217212.1 hypothetical protein [Clostridium estertheticum]WAG58076.1 hypothetical protein LL033_25295 [Clostridium estertheticum]
MTYKEENIQLNAGIETIYGTVTLPEIYTEVPVVLIIAGSGPTNRNGNNTQGLLTDSYTMIAYELAQNGIASVRYDKMGIGESSKAMKSEKDLKTYSNPKLPYLLCLRKV